MTSDMLPGNRGSAAVSDRDLFIGYRIRVIYIGLLVSWLAVIAYAVAASRSEGPDGGQLLLNVILLAGGVLLLTLTPWRSVLATRLGDPLILIWCTLAVTGLLLGDELRSDEPIVAAFLIGYTGNAARFATPDHYAAYNGTAPIEYSSGGKTRHRLSLRGNRKLNHAIHMAAICQLRQPHSEGRAYFDRKVADALGRGEPLAGLWATEPGIYGRFGFGQSIDAHELTVGAKVRPAIGNAQRGLRLLRAADPQDYFERMQEHYRSQGTRKPFDATPKTARGLIEAARRLPTLVEI